MLSEIDKDLKKVNGTWAIVKKEYPNWYGFEDVGYIWRGSWSDPVLEYKGNIINCPMIEDTMWERYTHDDDGNYLSEREEDEEGFVEYMKENAYEVYELLENAITLED